MEGRLVLKQQTNFIGGDSKTMSAQLSQFCTAWLQLPKIVEPELIPHKLLDPNLLIEFIDSFQIAMDKTRGAGLLVNVWEVAGLKRNEVRIAGVLNWLLDSHGSHGQKHNLCVSLLNSISLKLANRARDVPMSKFPGSQNLCSATGQARYRAITEVCPLGERENRVDIEINGDGMLLFIEVKIDAQQGDSQLARYHKIAQVKAQGRPWGVIYLTPAGDLPVNARELPNTISFSWRGVSDTFHNYADSMPSGNLARHYVEQFARFVAQF